MVKGYILKKKKNLSVEKLFSVSMSILFSKEVPWDFRVCAHPAIKDVLYEDPAATTIFFIYFFFFNEERLFHLDIIWLPWPRGHKPETHDVNLRKTEVGRKKNIKHPLCGVHFFFLLQDDQPGPLLYIMDRCFSLTRNLNVQDGPQSATVVTFAQ